MRLDLRAVAKTFWQALFATTRFEGIVFGRGDVPSEVVARVAVLMPHASDKDRDEFSRFTKNHKDVVVVTTKLSTDAVIYAMNNDHVLALVTTPGSLMAHGAIVTSEYLLVPKKKRKLFVCGAKGISRRVATGDSVRIKLQGGIGTTATIEKLEN